MKRLHHKVWPVGRPHDIKQVKTTLDEELRKNARRFPDKPATVFYGEVKSYRDLAEEVAYIAGYLQSQCNVKSGDRVGLYLQNAPQFVAGFYGIIRAGCVVVPINPMNLEDELAYIVEDAGIEVVLAAQDRCEYLAALLDDGRISRAVIACYRDALPNELPDSVEMALPKEISASKKTDIPDGCVAWSDMLAAEIIPAAASTRPQDLAVMPYTSGSTGKGKGCKHTHMTTLHATQSMYDWFGLTGDDVYLSAAPMFHVVGMQAGMNSPIVTGATMVILPRWDREIAADLIRTHQISVWPTVPTMVIDFLNRADLKDDDLASMRCIFGGGIAMPSSVASKLHNLTGLTFLEGYGMTETIAPTTANPVHLPQKQCGGIPVFNTDVFIGDPENQSAVPQGKVGEILISGPQVMLGYWKNPKADAETFVSIEGQRFVRSGDLGYLDENGYLFIVDRLKRMINASGFKVWPTEVESILYGHPAIEEACVIGANDPYRGETVKAVVVLQKGAALTPEELAKWAKDHMAAYKIPRLLETVTSLPKSGSGKVLWRELQEAENKTGKEP
jgi:fatty-acyl-CoA synthase